MHYLFAILAGYALGSLPFAYWLGRLRGVDLRSVGTGNPGAANLFRRVSKALGVLAALLDGAKGALAVLVGDWLGLPQGATLLPGMASVVGHWHSPLLGLGGGGGLAAAIGVTIGASPVAGAIGLAVGVAATAVGRSVGRGAGMGWIAFLGLSLGLKEAWPVVVGVMVLGLILLGRALLLEKLAARR